MNLYFAVQPLKCNSRCPYRHISSKRKRLYVNHELSFMRAFHSRYLKQGTVTSWFKTQADIANGRKQWHSTWPTGAVNEIWLLLRSALGGSGCWLSSSSSLAWPLHSGPETEQQIRTSLAGKPSNPPAAAPRHLSLVILPFLKACLLSSRFS